MTITIEGRAVGAGAPCLVIAEAGVNHNGNEELALKLVDAAADAGADAVKFQTFDPAALAAADAPKAEYQKDRSTGASQREMLQALTLPEDAYARLQARAKVRGLLFLSSPFDDGSARFLNELGIPAFKIASGELTNHPFLERIARWGRPMLVSTGMSTLDEVDGALGAIRRAGNAPVALFHCVSSYPANPSDANLSAIETLRRTFNLPVGWSDHTNGIHISLAAVARGAELIEKHLTLDRTMPGPDHAASIEPREFAELVKQTREIEAALGSGVKQPVHAELAIAAVARKSLHWASTLAAGESANAEAFAALRPGTGLSPALLPSLIGRRLRSHVKAGQLVTKDDFE